MDVDGYIETIAKALSERDGRGGGGRATAIIGAGFSLNAEPLTKTSRRFPLWRDIVRPLIDELVPPCEWCGAADPCPADRPRRCPLWERRRSLHASAAGASGMMTLGDKFEAQKGAARLRAALEQAVPDEDYQPGLAHQLLVRLPWADIFTTNWDSLLERAVDTYDRSYDTVVTVDQIASTSSPRIVKLHGCARSGTRLIFTEEDFRSYPVKYAPFVSLVQQSLMENVVVLFGFSGADPNFRAWHGWVRDHLRTNLQPLYLVTVRPIDPIDIHLMSGRLINTIDLSQHDKWKNKSDSQKIEAFLEGVHQRLRHFRPDMDWPSSKRFGRAEDGGRKPAGTIDDWRDRLASYPRWLVAPARNREELIVSLSEAVAPAFDADRFEASGLKELGETRPRDPAKARDRRSRELESRSRDCAILVAQALLIGLARPSEALYRRLETLLAGLLGELFSGDASAARDLDDLAAHISAVWTDAHQSAAGPENESERARALLAASDRDRYLGRDPAHTRAKVRDALPLIELVEREARLRSEKDKARTLRDILWLAGGEGEGRELVLRAAIWRALGDVDTVAVDALLQKWPTQSSDASGNLRRAAVHREVGRLRVADHEISEAVGLLRTLGSARQREMWVKSREAWGYFLYADLIDGNWDEFARGSVGSTRTNLTLDEKFDELQERLDELEAKRCDPRRELRELAGRLANAITQSRATGGAPLADDSAAIEGERGAQRFVFADPASTFVILCETTGLPIAYRQGAFRLAIAAAELVAPTNRRLALGLLLRSSAPEDIPLAGSPIFDRIFDPARALEDFDTLATILARLVASPAIHSEVVDGRFLDRKVVLLQHLVAGLILRATNESAGRLAEQGFALACRVAKSPIFLATGCGWDRQLFLFEAAIVRLVETTHSTLEALITLFDLPVPNEFESSRASAWPDPFKLLTAVWMSKENNVSSPATEVKARELLTDILPLGKELIESARRAIVEDPAKRGNLEQLRDKWRAIDRSTTGPLLRPIIRRRLAVLENLINISDLQ